MLSDTTIIGKLYVGLLKFDDLDASLESLTGTITAKGDLNVTGTLIAKEVKTEKLSILGTQTANPNPENSGASIGKAVIPAQTTEMTIETTAASSNSAFFVTPDYPVAVSASATDSGRFTVRIPTAEEFDISINWWIIN
jgi:hypothetical protein